MHVQIATEIETKIREFRLSKDLTNRSLADIVGMKENNQSRLELGKTNPTLKTLLRICSALEIEVKELFD